jgi:hypothetical protein
MSLPRLASLPDPSQAVGAAISAVDRCVRPLVRRGVLRVPPVGAGVVLLEVAGRRTGVTREVPVLAARFGDRLVVSTVRRRSNWVRNLAADDAPEVWLNGRLRPAGAQVRGRGPSVALLRVA